jgi:hypothetical protein
MKSVEFSQSYYLKRAAELGISLELFTGPPRREIHDDTWDSRYRRDGTRHEHKSSRRSKTGSSRLKQSSWMGDSSRGRREDGRGQRVGSVWDGYGVETFGRKADPLRDWEWEEPVAEVVSDVVWSEDEEKEEEIKVSTSLGKEGKAKDGIGGSGDCNNVVIADGGSGGSGGGNGNGDGGGGGGGDDGSGEIRRVAPPRGKSWMIATEAMIKDYIP